MNLHELKASPGARRARRRVGRGESSGVGKTSGRGHKGQYARKGHKHRAGFEGGQMPLMDCFSDGADVTAEALREAGLVRGRWDGIKLLGTGELSRKLTVRVNAYSASARAKVEALGGSCEVVAN
jgi:large subunit ribosomal protein L15